MKREAKEDRDEDVGTKHGIAAHLPTRFDGSEGWPAPVSCTNTRETM